MAACTSGVAATLDRRFQVSLMQFRPLFRRGIVLLPLLLAGCAGFGNTFGSSGTSAKAPEAVAAAAANGPVDPGPAGDVGIFAAAEPGASDYFTSGREGYFTNAHAKSLSDVALAGPASQLVILRIAQMGGEFLEVVYPEAVPQAGTGPAPFSVCRRVLFVHLPADVRDEELRPLFVGDGISLFAGWAAGRGYQWGNTIVQACKGQDGWDLFKIDRATGVMSDVGVVPLPRGPGATPPGSLLQSYPLRLAPWSVRVQ